MTHTAPAEPETIADWLRGRLPDEWFTTAPEVTMDRDEVLIVGSIAVPEGAEDEAETRQAAEGRIARFREDTRDARIRIARELEHRAGRAVSWGARCGDVRALFTTVSAPAMTRLRQPERIVLDTLVESGVARSRSDALAWCVRLVGQHTADWLDELRDAMVAVQRLREQGPDTDGAPGDSRHVDDGGGA